MCSNHAGTDLGSPAPPEFSRRIPLLDNLEVVVFMLSKRMDGALDQQLALIKQRVEEPHNKTPEAPLEPASRATPGRPPGAAPVGAGRPWMPAAWGGRPESDTRCGVPHGMRRL